MSKIPWSAQQNAWTLYQSGFSTGWIAERIYRRYGFKNPSSCQAALFRHWKFKQLRDKGQAARARFDGGVCSGCGCAYEQRTRNCDTCTRRHNNPGRYGNVIAPGRSGCAGCGGPMDECRSGCKQCTTRHSLRRRRARKESMAA